jgi:uncharacterized membrane protein
MTTKATLLSTVLGSLKLYHLEFDGVDDEAREVLHLNSDETSLSALVSAQTDN